MVAEFTWEGVPIFLSKRFQEELDDSLKQFGTVSEPLGNYALHRLEISSKWLDNIPRNVSEFMKSLATVLSPEVVGFVRAGLKRFNRLVGKGHAGLGDRFIREYTYRTWIADILHSLEGALNTADPRSSYARNMSWPKQAANAGLELEIKQIHLHGPDLKSAFASNDFIQNLLAPPADFSPLDPNTYPVYQARRLPIRQIRMFGAANRVEYGGMQEGVINTELAPMLAAYTSYSLLYCIANAAFKSNISDLSTLPGAQDHFQDEWEYDGKQYQGLLVWEYDISNPPVPAEISQDIIPQDRFDDWLTFVRKNPGYGTDGMHEIWVKGRHIHGSATEKWPDLLHAVEEGEAFRAITLDEAPGGVHRIYRTAFGANGYDTGVGEKYLRSRLTKTRYAVSFMSTVPDRNLGGYLGNCGCIVV
ncbi:hypothetical protein BJ508DRAFT_39386 [Ascobolus immersus RN42]|uniref:Uncharacterized protein n=1 Tax=Ascobolus immersus RN42 TaxID=1160509 RepID=A0A3N4HP58_ASCIM|nr:hypothetical protein BJ508DRAFT_39386 [Ascobolus immersus RN42]